MGIRARTTQSTCGSVSSSFCGLCDVVSTGIGLIVPCERGVAVPGVAGGVKAGLRRVFGGGEADLS